VRIELIDRDARPPPPVVKQALVVSRAAHEHAASVGRANMHYRDLLPGRAGGGYIASLIRIVDGGPVPDYVHHHRVAFQMIYCRRGWVRVVYEDQGPPFLMHAGDCVLQPPTIRHRVLEASAGLEVIEIGCPAEHETFRDHAMELPTHTVRPERLFEGQRFVRHRAAEAPWHAGETSFDIQDTAIANATRGRAGVRILRDSRSARGSPGATTNNVASGATSARSRTHGGEFLFLFALEGSVRIKSSALGDQTLDAGDACMIPAGADYAIACAANTQVLEVCAPARD
jgi:quercetin dioxygenase-like cupin family protein